jgi:hypothetical protein
MRPRGGVSSRYFALLMRRYPELLPRSAIRGYQRVLSSNIALLGAQDLTRVGPIDLVITGWPCQGHTQAGRGEGLHDPRFLYVLGNVTSVTPSSNTSGMCSRVHSRECTFVG